MQNKLKKVGIIFFYPGFFCYIRLYIIIKVQMEDIKRLENQYLKAKIAYYEGEPIMEDHEFDGLEKILKEAGSKVHEQVGSKRKDFDFSHPTKMLSLSKIQTEKGDHKKEEFLSWFSKRASIVGKTGMLEASPKFDGSAINIIYRDGRLENILTRGDGLAGKNLTKRLAPKVPNKVDAKGIVQIRCEVVVDTNLFEKKYASEFKNARNFVAGVLGKDDYDTEKINDLTLIPLHFITNGKHQTQDDFVLYSRIADREGKTEYPDFCRKWNTQFVFEQYEDIIKEFEEKRKTLNFQLDGVVISFPVQVRKDLGENDHDPEWALAIKFVPEGAVTKVVGVEWNIGKRGQFTPVVLLDPVELVGTTVKRASGYNAGFLKDNGLGKGAIVAVEKAGDIIPEIVKVIDECTETFVLPSQCPDCGTKLDFDGIHLTCSNEKCPGRIAKILATGSGILDLKGIGSERLKPFAKDFKNIYEIWIWVLKKETSLTIEKYGIAAGSRLHQIFTEAFLNIKSIPYEKVVQILGYENVGRKITQQLAREHAGLDFSYASLERALVEKLHTPEVESYIKEAVSTLESLGVTVDRPQAPKEDEGLTGVTLTGSPKAFGFPTKKEFLAKYPNLYEVDLKDATFLVTDDLNSTSSKMATANKKGIKIKTYGQF